MRQTKPVFRTALSGWVWEGCTILVLLSGGTACMGGRVTLNLNPDWKFIRADQPGAERIDFNDHSWQTVSTPHTYNDVDTFNHFSPGLMLGDTNQWSGRTWYRKTFTLPDSYRGRNVFVEFEAIRQVAEVYLNGHDLGGSKNGFVPFGFDLTRSIRFGRPNVLAVMCDNRFMTSGASNDTHKKITSDNTPQTVSDIQADQIPWNNPQWHPPLGGIYRNVRLYVTDPLHISLPLYDFLQTGGPYVYATEISRQSAAVTVEIPVQNGRPMHQRLTVEAQILNHEGVPIATWDQPANVEAAAQSIIKLSGVITAPRLWEPDYPYLYRVICSVKSGDETVDSCTIPLGIRTVHWDVKTGFSINGHHLKLHGWGQRPTDEWPGLGTAQPDWLHYYTLDLMKQAGGNFVRWGHCAGGPAMIRASDELGLIADQPGVDGEADTDGAAWKIRAAAFRDLIIFYRNNPSILIWEGGNQKVTGEHAAELRHFVQEFDPHGGRVYAHRRADEITGQFMDVSIGTEGSHELPRLPVVEGEYDREESPRRVWDEATPPEFGYTSAIGQSYDLTSEQYAVNEVAQYVGKLGAADHCGGANWIFSDTISGGRNTVEVDRASGEVDGVRLPKEAYFVCQAMFRNHPQAHIIGHWNYPPGTRKTVYVASNCEKVELFVNGKPTSPGKRFDRFLFTFPAVDFVSGEIKAVASNGGLPVATNIIRTAGAPVALRLTPITGPAGLLADGADVALIDVEALDENGERCPTFQRRVTFAYTGPAVWRGGYDSGQTNSINNLFIDLEAGINRVALRSTLVNGDIIVNAQCPGLRPASVTLSSHWFPAPDGISSIMPATPTHRLTPVPPDWKQLVTAMPPLTIVTASEKGNPMGHFTKIFNYTGPTELVHVETDAANGKNIYCDREVTFADLPPTLIGADWVQAADADQAFSAADLMQISAKAGTAIYVAFDQAFPQPQWLANQFHSTTLSFSIKGHVMQLFKLKLETEQSVTLGSNAGAMRTKTGNMYIVFVQDDGDDLHASR